MCTTYVPLGDPEAVIKPPETGVTGSCELSDVIFLHEEQVLSHLSTPGHLFLKALLHKGLYFPS